MSYTLSEFESKELLREAGIQMPDERLARTADDAVEAAEAIGLPVALKLCGRGIAHKTERGLVSLGLADAAQVRAEAERLLGERRSGEEDAAVLVSPMISGRRELIAGLVRDPQFGPCVMLGLGGIFAEALDDVSFAVAPLQEHDAGELIDSLRFSNILGAFRGEPEVDRSRLSAVLETLGRIGRERPEVQSIDINPLIVSGAVPTVVDALVEIEGASA